MICDEDPLRRRPRESTARRKRQERCVWMARKMTEWPSKRGPITKIMPSDGCIGDTVPLAVGKWYEFHEFGWYMGNVGLENSDVRWSLNRMKMPIRILSLIAVILSGLWIYYNGTLESWLAFVVALSAMLSTFLNRSGGQQQVVTQKSTGIQAGRDVVVNNNHRTPKDSVK